MVSVTARLKPGVVSRTPSVASSAANNCERRRIPSEQKTFPHWKVRRKAGSGAGAEPGATA
eukprot:4291662-Prymnesium_polylepis.2